MLLLFLLLLLLQQKTVIAVVVVAVVAGYDLLRSLGFKTQLAVLVTVVVSLLL